MKSPCADNVFPCEISCPLCREALRCNERGMPAPKWERCTNGRCANCCPQVCKHVTTGETFVEIAERVLGPAV